MKNVLIVGDDQVSIQIFDFLYRSFSDDMTVRQVSLDGAALSELLREADWVIEATGQSLEKKQTILRLCSELTSGLVTSDSSIIPRQELLSGLPSTFAKRYAVTHFFLPLSHCPLVELIANSGIGQPLTPEFHRILMDVLSNRLGRTVVEVSDKPGFIANRLGLFLIANALSLSAANNVKPIAIDRAAIGSLGLPRTALFGTGDLIGHSTLIDLLLALSERLSGSDPLRMITPRAVARLEDVRSTGREKFIDRSAAKTYKSTEEDEKGAVELVKNLRLDRDRYLQQIYEENEISPTLAASIMRKSYGWNLEC